MVKNIELNVKMIGLKSESFETIIVGVEECVLNAFMKSIGYKIKFCNNYCIFTKIGLDTLISFLNMCNYVRFRGNITSAGSLCKYFSEKSYYATYLYFCH